MTYSPDIHYSPNGPLSTAPQGVREAVAKLRTFNQFAAHNVVARIEEAIDAIKFRTVSHYSIDGKEGRFSVPPTVIMITGEFQTAMEVGSVIIRPGIGNFFRYCVYGIMKEIYDSGRFDEKEAPVHDVFSHLMPKIKKRIKVEEENLTTKFTTKVDSVMAAAMPEVYAMQEQLNREKWEILAQSIRTPLAKVIGNDDWREFLVRNTDMLHQLVMELSAREILKS